MPEIRDKGKVWLRGRFGTSFAVKVDDQVYVPGQEEGQSCEYWLEDGLLCFDLHDPAKELRIARRFPLTLEATHPATLFNGFAHTKHADVKVITFEDEGVESWVISKEDYRKDSVGNMDRKTFWKKSGFNR